MITDNRTMGELRVACFGEGRCLGDVLEYFNGEREFPNIERQQMIAIVSRALDHDDPNLVYTAISCVKKMLWREERQIRPKSRHLQNTRINGYEPKQGVLLSMLDQRKNFW